MVSFIGSLFNWICWANRTRQRDNFTEQRKGSRLPVPISYKFGITVFSGWISNRIYSAVFIVNIVTGGQCRINLQWKSSHPIA